jgi:hypothetical protein
VYGLTLTLAYTRAIADCGEDMLNTHFIFMNADFVLADGSLRSLMNHVLAGRSIVLGPSFRATAETVEPHLRAVVTDSGVLAIPPRHLARLALPHPHPTTVAKIVNQGFCHSSQPNQFFWRLDKQTLLGRYYLIFMLCLKPERIVRRINSYCDYSFIPEMCPSGDEVAMDDSDQFFMLELQRRNQEMFLVRLGTQSDAEIAASLSSWTTAEHRRAAKFDIVFHAADLPPGIGNAKAEARAFVENIERMLGPPLPHTYHPHWVGGVDVFLRLRKENGFASVPAELDALPEAAGETRRPVFHPARRRLRSLISAVHRLALGRAPLLTPLSPVWLDFRHLRHAIAPAVDVPGRRALIVRDDEVVDKLLPSTAGHRLATLQGVLRDGFEPFWRGSESYTDVFIYVFGKNWRQLRRLMATCKQFLEERPDCACHLFLHCEMENDDLSTELFDYLEDSAGAFRPPSSISFVGGSLTRFNSRALLALRRQYNRFGIAAWVWILPAVLALIPTVLLTNLYLKRKLPSSRTLKNYSSVHIRFDPLPRQGQGGLYP